MLTESLNPFQPQQHFPADDTSSLISSTRERVFWWISTIAVWLLIAELIAAGIWLAYDSLTYHRSGCVGEELGWLIAVVCMIGGTWPVAIVTSLMAKRPLKLTIAILVPILFALGTIFLTSLFSAFAFV